MPGREIDFKSTFMSALDYAITLKCARSYIIYCKSNPCKTTYSLIDSMLWLVHLIERYYQLNHCMRRH